MVKKSENIENEIRDKLVHMAFSEREKKMFKKYTKEGFMTLSEFIRQAMYDKIMRIDNPGKFGLINSNDNIIIELIKEIKENLKHIIKYEWKDKNEGI